jgi:hypothetical protein
MGLLNVLFEILECHSWYVEAVRYILLCHRSVMICLVGRLIHVLFTLNIVSDNFAKFLHESGLLRLVDDGCQTLNAHGFQSIDLGQLCVSEGCARKIACPG